MERPRIKDNDVNSILRPPQHHEETAGRGAGAGEESQVFLLYEAMVQNAGEWLFDAYYK